MLNIDTLKYYLPEMDEPLIELAERVLLEHLVALRHGAPELSVLLNLIDREMNPYVGTLSSAIYHEWLSESVPAIFPVVIALPGEGKSTFISQATLLQKKALTLIQNFLIDLSQRAASVSDISIRLPTVSRGIEVFHISFDEARASVLSTRKDHSNRPLNSVDWVKVNSHMLGQLTSIMSIPSDHLKVVFIEIPGIFGEADRGLSLLHYVSYLQLPIFVTALFSDPAIAKKSLVLREFVLTEEEHLYRRVLEEFNTELVGFSDTPIDDQEIKRIFKNMCPPHLISEIKTTNLLGAKKIRESEKYKAYLYQKSISTLVDLLSDNMPFLSLLAPDLTDEIQLMMMTSYWYLTEKLHIPADNVSLVYNKKTDETVFYDIRQA